MSFFRRWQFLKTQYGFRRAPLVTVARLISWGVRCLAPQKEIIVTFRKWGLRMVLPASWRGLAKFIFVFRENYEPELKYLERFLSPGKTFVDVGANLGIYSALASRLVGENGHVLAFEPTMLSFAGLQKNIKLNPFSNALAFQVALAERNGKAWLYYGTDPVRNSLGKDPACQLGAEEVTVESLDDVLRRVSVSRVDVIKIDAEGAEELVLRGAIRTLVCMRPVIIYEVNAEASAKLGLLPHGGTKLLEELDYEFFVEGKPEISSDLGVARGYFNVVAIPRHREQVLTEFPTATIRNNMPEGPLDLMRT